MPDFLPILLLAIVIFAVLLIVFGGGFVSVPSEHRYLTEDTSIEFGSFEVSYTASEINATSRSGEISNGVFNKNEERIGFIAMDPSDVSESLIDLKISNTNSYGKMFISINGKEVYSDYPAVGETLISFDPSILQENNILEIRCESSGWRIWAPTIYDFSLDIKLDYTNKKSKSFVFEISDLEKQYMTNARIVAFGNRTGVGDLIVSVNTMVIASGVTTLYQDFSASVLHAGNNTIEFYVEPNTSYHISTSQLILFFE